MAELYNVAGMTCGGCAQSVTRAITRVAPAAKVAVDLAAGTVSVDGAIAAEAVQKAVEAAGFEFRGRS